MDLIDRYLIAVGRQLPGEAADDIVAELGDSLRSEAEEHERATGRPISEAEQSALLKKRGHPWLMASRYQPQQYLIGPALFPYYRQALQIIVFWVMLPLVLVGAALNVVYSSDPSVPMMVSELVRAVTTAGWNGAIYCVGMITIVFAILDHEKVRINLFDNWNPAKLPEPTQGRVIPRSESLLGLIFSLIFLAWWTGLVRLPDAVLRPHAGLIFAPAPIWTTLHLPILATAIAGAGVHLVDLVRPWRTVTISVIDMTTNFACVIILMVILRSGEYILVSGPGVTAENVDRAHWVNQFAEWTLLVVGAVALCEVGYELWHVLRSRRSVAIV